VTLMLLYICREVRSVNERIKALRKELKMSQDVFAEKLGLTKNYISLVENGNRNLSEQSIKVLCSILNVNEEWLRTGNGKMFKSRTREQEIGAFVNEVMELNDDSFEKKLVSALARLEPKDWECLESIAKKLLDEK
jgi:transcriptional regulator with XRE-family HTH domain